MQAANSLIQPFNYSIIIDLSQNSKKPAFIIALFDINLCF